MVVLARLPPPPDALHSPAYDAILPQLAMELAADLEPPLAILQKYGVTQPQLDVLKSSPLFQRLLDDAVAKFKSLGNTGDRIKIKAQLLTELGLEFMHDVMQDTALTPAARVGAFAAVKSLTGLDRPVQPEAGMKFELVITLPNAAPTMVIEGTVTSDKDDDILQSSTEDLAAKLPWPSPDPREFFGDPLD